jgi:hypothetical protein
MLKINYLYNSSMKKLKTFALISLIAILAIYGCKKEEVNNQQFVQGFIIGKWPLKYNIRTISNANFGDRNDTLITYNPIDTLVFTADGKVSRRNKTVISTMSYSIDETGENITFTGTTATTLKLIYVRSTSLIIGKEAVSSINGQEVKTTVADYYIK